MFLVPTVLPSRPPPASRPSALDPLVYPEPFGFPIQIPRQAPARPGQADLGSGAFLWTGHLGVGGDGRAM